jgi:hypothetical protein
MRLDKLLSDEALQGLSPDNARELKETFNMKVEVTLSAAVQQQLRILRDQAKASEGHNQKAILAQFTIYLSEHAPDAVIRPAGEIHLANAKHFRENERA